MANRRAGRLDHVHYSKWDRVRERLFFNRHKRVCRYGSDRRADKFRVARDSGAIRQLRLPSPNRVPKNDIPPFESRDGEAKTH